MVEKAKFIWFDGKFIPWEQAQVHVLTHTLHYGLGVFEGIRAYHCHDGRTAIFRLKEHIQRLFDSGHVMMIEIPFKKDDIEAACCEILRLNGQKEAYIRPLVFLGEGVMGLNPKSSPIQVAIISWVWGAYTSSSASATVVVRGFSTSTWQPASRQSRTTAKCWEVGTATLTAETSGRSSR